MKYLLFAGSMCLALVMVAGVCAQDPDLVIYYSYDNFADVVPDESGKGHDGTVVGDVTPDAGGQRGGAARFANGGYLDLDGPNFPTSDAPVDGISICTWMKLEDTGGHHEIFNARASDTTWLTHPEPRSDGQVRWLVRSYGATTIMEVRAGQWVAGEWVHFAGIYSNADGMGTLYLNGEKAGETPGTGQIAGDWGMGARVGKTIDDARPFTGLMDDFCIYKRALSQDEVRGVMDFGPPSAAPVPDEDTLAATWGKIKSLR
jgi:hypothetical protein